MRRNLALVLTLAFVLFYALGAVPLDAEALTASDIVIKSFTSETYSVNSKASEAVKFTAQIDADRNLKSNAVAVYDDMGNIVAYMNDNGKNGDATANDGTYTALAKLSNNGLRITDYYAKAGNAISATHSIKFCDPVTDRDMADAQKIWVKLNAYKEVLVQNGYTPEEIAKSTYKFLLETEADSVAVSKMENERSFSFMLKSGIENYFEHFEDETEYKSTLDFIDSIKGISYIESSAIGVWCPYYGSDSNFNYCYRDAALELKDAVEFDRVDSYYGSDSTVESFKNFDQYGVILVDSHGASYNGGGYICIPRPGSYDNQDIEEGHLVLSGGTVYLRGTFMEKYCDTLPNTIVYVGICHGMQANNLYGPLLNHGAGFVCGYDESVSFAFDNLIMAEFCKQLGTTNTETGLQNTASQAFDATVAKYGSVDSYSSTRAEFVWEGDGDVTAAPVAVPVESVEMAESLDLYRNNSYEFELTFTPSNANRWSAEWTSDNESIATVSEKGVVTAHAHGTATITCTITDSAVEPAAIYTKSCIVNVVGDMPVSGLNIEEQRMTLYLGVIDSAEINASVQPENATDQSLIYKSCDENIATVDEHGIVTAVGVGATLIRIETSEGHFSGYVTVSVKTGDLNKALNKYNGDLHFTATGTSPITVNDEDRFAVYTNNHSNSSSSTIKLDAGRLEAGTVLKFDWMVSSEDSYDYFAFTVNNTDQNEISGSEDWSTYTYHITSTGNYVFEWTYSKDSSLNAMDDCGGLDEVEILGNGITHTVNFYDRDGSTLLATEEVAHGTAATPPTPTVYNDGAFIAWSEDYTQIYGDVDITALYAKDAYTVTFVDGLTNEVLGTETVESGNNVTLPTAPEHDGYTFTGWDHTGENITESITITAQYELNVYTVTFVDGITGETISTATVNHGENAALPEAPIHEGYTFTGWDHTGEGITSDITITALYTVNTYTVTFVDGLTGEAISSAAVNHGENVIFPDAPVHDGYTFTGWDHTGESITADITITALYEADILLGDSNNDGIINTADAVMILRHAANLTVLEGNNLKAADANRDGTVNTADAVAILRHSAGLINLNEEE